MKLWAFFFVVWVALCGLGYVWLHPEVSQETGILPGDLPVELTPMESAPKLEVIPVETH